MSFSVGCAVTNQN